MRVTSKGQVTIPQAIREAAGLLPGTEIDFVLGDDGIVRVRRQAEQPADPALDKAVAGLRGAARRATTAPLSTDEIMALTRG